MKRRSICGNIPVRRRCAFFEADLLGLRRSVYLPVDSLLVTFAPVMSDVRTPDGLVMLMVWLMILCGGSRVIKTGALCEDLLLSSLYSTLSEMLPVLGCWRETGCLMCRSWSLSHWSYSGYLPLSSISAF